MEQSFGGKWTEDKLDCLRKYLRAYLAIMTKRQFRLTYIDAFAGTGERFDPESEEYRQGSASIAVASNEFDSYVLAESHNEKCSALVNTLKANYPNSAGQIEAYNEDGNEVVKRICHRGGWRERRGLAFLDPFGAQLEWTTLEMIADTKAIDVWILMPFATINRLLPKNGIIESQRAVVTRFFGTSEWESELYKPRPTRQGSLFEEDSVEPENYKVDYRRVGDYYIERLKTVFPLVCPNPLFLRNSTNSIIFMLCFAAANPNASAALKIAGEIIEKKQREM